MFLLMLLCLALIIIRPQEYPALVDSFGFPLLPVVLAAALLSWLFYRRKTFAAPQYVLLPVFLLVLMFSKVVNGWVGGTLMVLEFFGVAVVAFVLLANAISTRARVRAVMAVFAICACVLALHGIEQVSTGMGWTGVPLSQGTRIQYVGIFNDPNDLGMLFVMALPMAVYLGGRGGLMGMRRVVWWIAAALLLCGIYFTNSRGTLLALLVVVGLYIWLKRGLLAAGTLGAIALAGLLALPSRLQGLQVSEESAMGRVESWYHGIQMFASNPVFGIGAGAFSDRYALTAHNSFVLVLAETGAIGFTVWLAFIGYCFLMGYSVTRMPRIPEAQGAASTAYDTEESADWGDDAYLEQDAEWRQDRSIAIALWLSFCGCLVSAFFLSRTYAIVIYLLAAMITAQYTMMRERYPGMMEFRLGRDLLRWSVCSAAAIAGLYATTKLLFALS